MDEKIKELLEKNLKLSEDIHDMVKSIKNYVIMQRIWGFLKLLIIVVPIILGIIYLPPLFKNFTDQYKALLNPSVNPIEGLLKSSTGGLNLNGIDINSLPPELKKLLK